MGNYIISIDIGTQGTKAALFNIDMELIATAFENSKLVSPEVGHVWQEADDIYFSCARTMRELVDKTGINKMDIHAIGIDGQMAGIMGIDEQGEAVTYYDSWLDMRCGKYMNKMRETAGKRIIEVSGGPVSYNHAPKILWWQQEMPEVYRKINKFVLPHAYVVGKMTGLSGKEAYIDYTNLHFSGFGDNIKKEWSKELLDIFHVEEEKMPRIVSPFDVIGKTTKEFASISGLVEGIPVVAGCGDTAASTFGSGMFECELVQDCAGTASVLCSVVNDFIPDVENETMTMMRSPVDGLWLPLAYINGGGMCIRWFRDNFSGKEPVSYDELEKEAAEKKVGSEGILFCPHFTGRALPINPNLKGSFIGLDFKHTRGHMYRSIMEGIAYEYNYYLKIIKKLYPDNKFEKMISIGGGSNSRLLNQIKSDVLHVEVHTFEMGETALLGTAVIAAVGTGILPDYKSPIKRVMKMKDKFVPDEVKHNEYKLYSNQYLKALDALTGFYENK